MNSISAVYFSESEIRLVKLQINLFHDKCMSKFQSNELNEVKMFLRVSIPLKSGSHFFTIEDYYPVNTKRKISLIISELKKNSSVLSVKNWFQENNVLRISVVEKLEDSPFGLIEPLGILEYKETSKNGIDNITVVLNEINVRSLVEILNLIGDVKIVNRNEMNERMLDFGNVLSEKEELVMEKAISCGYFDYPRKNHLKDIAKEMNISIVAVDRYLRSAERKIILGGFGVGF